MQACFSPGVGDLEHLGEDLAREHLGSIFPAVSSFHNLGHHAQQLVLPRQRLILCLGVLQGSGMALSQKWTEMCGCKYESSRLPPQCGTLRSAARAPAAVPHTRPGGPVGQWHAAEPQRYLNQRS